MKKWTVVSTLAFAQFVMVLDSTVMNVSITQVVKDLNTTVNAMQAAIAMYTLTMAALMLIGAKLCTRLGLLKAFTIGSIIYAVGSLITAFSTSITMLFLGWSIIEGMGAILVIPAIVSLVASNYSGKDRVTAYAIIGGISGAAAAAGPLIGGLLTTYASWRFVFIAEVIIMLGVIFMARRFHTTSRPRKITIDRFSVISSSIGLLLIVFALLQSKTWGWIRPIEIPTIGSYDIAPLGISMVAYLLLLGIFCLKLFYDRQLNLIKSKKEPLVDVRMLSITQLRSGLGVLMAQYLITAAIFFVTPIYLQTVLGYNALETGIRILPLSFALIVFSIVGSRLVSKYGPKFIVRGGQILLVVGSAFMFGAIDTQLRSVYFLAAMSFVGSGLGLLASQLSNINLSSVQPRQSNEVGGLQGTFQNLGSSLGTALIGSVLIASLTSGFLASVESSNLSSTVKSNISSQVKTVAIIPASQVIDIAENRGASNSDAMELKEIYETSQLHSLRESLFFLVIISIAMLVFSRNIPATLHNK